MKKLMVPRKGVKVRDPNSGIHLPEEGAVRTVSSYYNRRVADGDLEMRAVPKAKTVKSTKKPKTDGDK